MLSTVKNVFAVLCVAMTFFMIFQLLHTFLLEKPTTTAKLEKKLEQSDLPEVVLCVDPGFNNVTLNNHGYHISTYPLGVVQPNNQEITVSQFVGWNGGNDEVKSSHDILEEALSLPKDYDLLTYANYTKAHFHYDEAVVSFKTLNDVDGRCIFISPPLIATDSHRLWVRFNTAAFDQYKLSCFKLNIYLMDKANSPHWNPDLMEMVGDRIFVAPEPSWYTYQTRISRNEHVEGDPLFDCAIYTKNDTYDMCIRKEIEALFM